VAAWERGDFELILMDVQMPEMDGFEATGMIRAMERTRGGHVPIVALTAHALKGDEERCLAVGMDGYVSKPVLGPALYTAMEKAMDGREVHEEIFMERRLSGGID
jgi:two-component system, sensor histidine kinase and response regulator